MKLTNIFIFILFLIFTLPAAAASEDVYPESYEIETGTVNYISLGKTYESENVSSITAILVKTSEVDYKVIKNTLPPDYEPGLGELTEQATLSINSSAQLTDYEQIYEIQKQNLAISTVPFITFQYSSSYFQYDLIENNSEAFVFAIKIQTLNPGTTNITIYNMFSDTSNYTYVPNGTNKSTETPVNLEIPQSETFSEVYFDAMGLTGNHSLKNITVNYQAEGEVTKTPMIPLYFYIILLTLGIIGLYLGFIEFRGKNSTRILTAAAAIFLLTAFVASAGVYITWYPPPDAADPSVILSPVWTYIPLITGLAVAAYVLLERKLIL